MFNRSHDTTDATRGVRADIEALQNDISRIAQHFGTLVGNVGTDGARAAKMQVDEMRGRLDDVVSTVGRRGYSMARDTMNERPVAAIVGAVAIGYVLATLLRRR